MYKPTTLSRRRLLVQGAQLSVAAAGLLTLNACDSSAGTACFNPDKRSKGEVFARSSRSYVEQSSEAGQNCARCSLYNGGSDSCGTCTIDNLPANPQGYCTSWSAAS